MKLSIPLKPTYHEIKKLGNYFHLYGWQFDKIIKNNCMEISSHVIGWDEETDEAGGKQETAVRAIIYGIQGVRSGTNQPVMCEVFLECNYRVYQPYNLEEAFRIIDCLKKEHKWEQYRYSDAYKKDISSKNIVKAVKKSIKKNTSSLLKKAA